MSGQSTIQLLVSVIALEEAAEAVQGCADILDLKSPREGSLGAAHPKLIAEVHQQFGRLLPVSAAIGDFPQLPNSAALAALCAAEMGADFVKVGLLGARSEQQALELLATLSEALAWRGHKTKLIAAAYGDFREAGTLDPVRLPGIARQARIAGCMIDTLNKKDRCLFDYMNDDGLHKFIDECREYSLVSSLAGSITFRHIGQLKSLAPDIVGVRGAVCNDGVRTARIDRQKVSELKLRLSGPVPTARKEHLQCAPAR